VFFAPDVPPPSRAPQPAALKPTKQPPKQFVGGRLLAPAVIPPKVASVTDPPALEPGLGSGVGVVGSPGFSGGPLNPVIEDVVRRSAVTTPPPVNREPPKEPPREPVRVGGDVRPPVPLFTPKPAYPPLARQIRVSGLVRLEAVIATDGSIRRIRLVQGHPSLVQATIDAVRQWRYTPTLLNGNPVEVVMYIDVHFTLSQ
jgi:protein TonB